MTCHSDDDADPAELGLDDEAERAEALRRMREGRPLPSWYGQLPEKYRRPRLPALQFLDPARLLKFEKPGPSAEEQRG
jgi:hypothetical protein